MNDANSTTKSIELRFQLQCSLSNLKSNAIENETVSSIGSRPESYQNCKATSVSFMNIPTPSAKSSAAQTAYR